MDQCTGGTVLHERNIPLPCSSESSYPVKLTQILHKSQQLSGNFPIESIYKGLNSPGQHGNYLFTFNIYYIKIEKVTNIVFIKYICKYMCVRVHTHIECISLYVCLYVHAVLFCIFIHVYMYVQCYFSCLYKMYKKFHQKRIVHIYYKKTETYMFLVVITKGNQEQGHMKIQINSKKQIWKI